MKQLKLVLFCLLSYVGYSQTVVTGNLLYQQGYNYGAGESVRITYLNKFIDVKIDSVQPGQIVSLLKTCGVDSVIYVGIYTSSVDDKFELWFAYNGPTIKSSDGSADLLITNSHHKFGGYAVNNALIVPQYSKINTDSMKQVVTNISKNRIVRSFMIKPWNISEVPLNIIARGIVNGELADMRYTPESYKLVPAFQRLNYNNIWYNDINGKAKNIRRPASGWFPKA